MLLSILSSTWSSSNSNCTCFTYFLGTEINGWFTSPVFSLILWVFIFREQLFHRVWNALLFLHLFTLIIFGNLFLSFFTRRQHLRMFFLLKQRALKTICSRYIFNYKLLLMMWLDYYTFLLLLLTVCPLWSAESWFYFIAGFKLRDITWAKESVTVRNVTVY